MRFLKHFGDGFLPWRQSTPWQKMMSGMALVIVGLGFGIIAFGEIFAVPLIIGLCVFIPLVLIDTIRNLRELNKDMEYSESIKYARSFQELPPDIQEEIMIVRARNRLADRDPQV